MGEAKNRGTREERIAAATSRVKQDPQYRYTLPYRNKALDFLWGQFRVTEDKTINDVRAEAVKAQEDARAKREADTLSAE